MNMNKAFIIGMLALVLAAIASAGVSAYDPYDGVNRIGAYYQSTNSVPAYRQGDLTNFYAPNSPSYEQGYIAPPRIGGWFGSGSEWLTGLRGGVYQQVPPDHYTSYYQPVTPYYSYYGGNFGYTQPTASQFYTGSYGGFGGYRGRVGGAVSY